MYNNCVAIVEDSSEAFVICDDYGYSILQVDENIKTKDFDSTDVNTDIQGLKDEILSFLKTENSGDSNFAIIDDFGYPIIIIDGNIKTKDFDSTNISLPNDMIYHNFQLAQSIKRRTRTAVYDGTIDYLEPIVHITDTHGDAVRVQRAFDVASKIGAAIVCSGDMVYYNSADDFEYMKTLVNSFNGKYIQCIGNHEARDYANEEDVYNRFIKPFENRWNMPAGVDYPTYSYYDDTANELRYISFNQYQCDGTTPHSQAYVTQDQIDFLLDTMKNIPVNYGLIIVMHSPEQNPVADASFDKFMQSYQLYTGISRLAILKDIVDAFITKTTINATYQNGSLTVAEDFSNVASNEFICYMCGHLHIDAISYVPNTQEKQLLLNEICTNAWMHKNNNGTSGYNYPYFNELNDLARQEDSLNQDAFNVYIIDRRVKSVRICRIGSDIPADFIDKRDFMTIPYV